MDSPFGSVKVVDVATRVRQNVGSAGLQAGILLLFGFFYFGGASGTGAFLAGDSLFQGALRLGGFVMLGIAIACSIGVRLAMAADAVATLLIGAAITIGSVLMLIGGLSFLNGMIYLLCGGSLIAAGLRTGREYLRLPPELDDDEEEEADDEDVAALDLPVDDDRPADRGAGPHRRRLVEESRAPRKSPGSGPQDSPPIAFDRPKPVKSRRYYSISSDGDDGVIRLDDVQGTPTPPPAAPPPEGYLAKLAEERTPRNQ
ncbi:MAG: hypothetical protein HY763_12695 [Planctomycetes bacterium]|nr:hypothetical protein [Planctomycetota bacterium]